MPLNNVFFLGYCWMNIVFITECMVSAHTLVDFFFLLPRGPLFIFSPVQNLWYLDEKGLKGSSHSLIKVVSRRMPEGTEERHEHHQSG